MRRSDFRAPVLAFCAVFALLGTARSALAQDEPTPPAADEPTPPGGEPTPPGSEPTPPGSEPTLPGSAPAHAATPEKGKLGSISWQDIVVVPRRPILKYHRLELVPTYNLSINNTLVREHGFGGIANFFLSETLNLGVEATYYVPQNLEHYFLVGLDDRVLPSANRYLWSAALNFGYVPIYGKFALFNKWIFQWEAYIQAGVGALESRWIPRDPANDAASNYDVMWHVDLGTRLFLTKWLVVHVYLKDYMFVDKFEPAMRTTIAVPPDSTWSPQFVQNLVFGVGLGMFLPTNFEYKYTR